MGGKRSSQVEVSGEISPPFCHVFWVVNENGSFHHFAKATNLFLHDVLQLFYIFIFFQIEKFMKHVSCVQWNAPAPQTIGKLSPLPPQVLKDPESRQQGI